MKKKSFIFSLLFVLLILTEIFACSFQAFAHCAVGVDAGKSNKERRILGYEICAELHGC